MDVFLDTNVFLRAILGDDRVKAKECLNLLEKVDSGKIGAATSILVLNEILWVLEGYGVEKKDIVKRLESIIMSNVKIIGAGDGNIALESLGYYEGLKLDFIDALNACIARKNKIKKIATYDEHFKKIEFLEALKPKEVAK